MEAYKKNIQAYADLVILEDKKHFQEGLETFSSRADNIREQVTKALEEFYQNYANGYKAVNAALKATAAHIPEVPEEKLKIFENPQAFMEAVVEGKTMAELLGYSYETMTSFYTALTTLFEKEDYKTVRNGFFFMIIICPYVPEYWTSLGIAEIRLGHYPEAEKAFKRALELDQISQDAYRGLLHLYTLLQKQSESIALCNEGMRHAQSHPEELRAIELEKWLKAMKIDIDH